MADDPLTSYRLGDTDNQLLRKILTRLSAEAVQVSNFPASFQVSNFPASFQVSNFPAVQSVNVTNDDLSNPLYVAARSGILGGKAAKAYHVLGRRSGFNSTSILQDVAEFLGTSTDAMPEPTGAETFELVSSSANDTAAGTGARAVRIAYLDTGNNIVLSSPIALNGVTPVSIGFLLKFVLWMEVSSVGSNTVSAGNIILRVAGPGATHEQITAGGNRSMSCRFMVPAGYTAYVPSWQATSIGSASQDVRLRATVQGDRTLGTPYHFQDNAFLVAGAAMNDELPWLSFPALCKIKVSTISSAAPNTNRIDSDFTVLLIQN